MAKQPEKETVGNGQDRDERGRFVPGNPGGPGRTAGEPNRIGGDLKADLWDAYHRRGGVEWLLKLPARVFTSLLAKLLPREVSADIRASIEGALDFKDMSDPELEATGHAAGIVFRRVGGQVVSWRDAEDALDLSEVRMVIEGQPILPPEAAAECLQNAVDALREHLPALGELLPEAEAALARLRGEAAG